MARMAAMHAMHDKQTR